MTLETIFAAFVFCASSAITPGPNNFIVLSASVRGGMTRALPPYLGICAGFPLMVLGIALLYLHYSDLLSGALVYIKYAGAAYLIFLSWKTFTAASAAKELDHTAGIPGFGAMLLFQWMNPKGWVMAVGSVVLVGEYQVWLAPLMFTAIAPPCVGVWLVAGKIIRDRIIGTPLEKHLNRIFGVLLALSVLMLL